MLTNIVIYVGGEQRQGLIHKTKDFMAGFDEEKKQLFKFGEPIYYSVKFLRFAKEFLSKYSLDPDIAASACVVLSTASSVASLKLPDVTQHKILMTVKDIEKGVNTILKTPLKKALENFDFILDAVESCNFEIAFEKISAFEDDAMTAFHYMDRENHISLTNFKECSKAAKLQMFAIILRSSYDRDKKSVYHSRKATRETSPSYWQHFGEDCKKMYWPKDLCEDKVLGV